MTTEVPALACNSSLPATLIHACWKWPPLSNHISATPWSPRVSAHYEPQHTQRISSIDDPRCECYELLEFKDSRTSEPEPRNQDQTGFEPTSPWSESSRDLLHGRSGSAYPASVSVRFARPVIRKHLVQRADPLVPKLLSNEGLPQSLEDRQLFVR